MRAHSPCLKPRQRARGCCGPSGVGILTAAVINAVIGSSIFGMPARQAELVGALSPLAYCRGWSRNPRRSCCASRRSRAASRTPGGPYLYARESFGPFVGFEAGWLTFWIRVTAVAANLNVFVEYLGADPADRGCGGGAAVRDGRCCWRSITVINLRGVRPATWSIDFFTLAKLAPLALADRARAAARERARFSPRQHVAQTRLDPGHPAAGLRLRRLRGPAHPRRRGSGTRAATPPLRCSRRSP